MSNGALIHAERGARDADPDLTVTLTKPLLLRLLFTQASDGVTFDGDRGVLPTRVMAVDRCRIRTPIGGRHAARTVVATAQSGDGHLVGFPSHPSSWRIRASFTAVRQGLR
ncbi:hypothetical protein FE697_003145 [Mumia zhuanghuii]|uniref:Alkyl sulfatase C-terminal domain-containing protein n=1 Tax=Mumia zhuanghuii TaxID=2585211 RepID=A0A5Q6S5G9_9ACTN|nr:hypothetical protein FE697_003145 [Mumia zhuanghuii]